MNKFEKANKLLPKLNIYICTFTLAFALVFPSLVNRPNIDSGFMYWSFIAFYILSLISMVIFTVINIISTIHTKKIMIAKASVLAYIVNVIFIASSLVFIYKSDLWFIFA